MYAIHVHNTHNNMSYSIYMYIGIYTAAVKYMKTRVDNI